GQPPANVLVVVRVAEGEGGHLDKLGAKQTEGVLLFLALRVRDNDDRAITARIGDQRQADAGIAGGAFDHEAAGAQFAALFGFQDHLAPGAVLDRAAGVHEFGLAENGAAGGGRGGFQLDERRVADRFNDTVAHLHSFSTLVERSKADKSAVWRVFARICTTRMTVWRLCTSVRRKLSAILERPSKP